MMSNAPKIRFKEFSGEWYETKLGEFVDIKSGISPSSYKLFALGEYPFLKVEDLNNCKKYQVFSRQYSDDTKNIIPNNSIIFPKRGAAILLNKVRINHNKVLMDSNLMAITPNDSASVEFLYYKIIKDKLFKIADTSTIPQINNKHILPYKVTIPTKPEQEKIASFLTSVDTKIERLTKKEALLQQYKKGVMQKIFSQEIRFRDDDGGEYSEWEERKLGEVAHTTTGNSNREDSSLDGEYTFFDRSEDIRTSNIYLFDGEAVIVAGEGQRFIPKYFIGKFDLHQRTYAIMNFNEAIGKFIYYFIYQNQNYFLSQAVGSTVKSLRLPMFQKMLINLPSVKEQTKIAYFLSSIDTKIGQVQKQLDSTKEFKKALLQKMFV